VPAADAAAEVERLAGSDEEIADPGVGGTDGLQEILQ
jgi:hypothetical protein